MPAITYGLEADNMNINFLVLAESSFWERLLDVFTTPSLSLFLLLGSAVLAIALLILTLTRWGHARPITKCVILSVIAHLLLLGYAYGTRMMFDVPVVKNEEPVTVHLLDYDYEIDEPESLKLETDEELAVEQFAADVLETETESLQRPVPETPFELERVFDNESVTTNILDSLPKRVDVAKLELESPIFQIQEPDLEFNDSTDEDLNNLEPEEIEFQRRGEGENDDRNFDPQFEPKEKLDITEQVNNVDIDPSILNQDSFPDEKERARQFESELTVPDAQHSLIDEFAAATGVDQDKSQNAADEQHIGKSEKQLIEAANQSRRLADGKPMPTAFRLRSISNRKAVAQLRGGSAETEDAVEAALKWLASTQQEDGRWDPAITDAGREDKVYGHDRGGCGAQADMGITALATLAFLGAGHSHLEGDYQQNVQQSLEFLIRHQAIDGDLSGDAKLFARMYCHSMALLALSETLAMTGDNRLTAAVTQGVGFTVQAQDKSGGGWRYQPGDKGDMSQFGWKVMALHSAELGGVPIQPATKQRMKQFLDSCRSGEHQGLASYRPGEGPSTTMTAESLVCNYFLNATMSEKGFSEAKRRIMTESPQASRTNLYYWYYATLALNQNHDSDWIEWNKKLHRAILPQQVTSGQNVGSWPPDGLWAGYGGRVYSTALATLSLEVYYRYLPENETSNEQAANIDREVGGLTR